MIWLYFIKFYIKWQLLIDWSLSVCMRVCFSARSVPADENRYKQFRSRWDGSLRDELSYWVILLGSRLSLWFVNITKTCLYNFDPLKPHFYIVKLGFTGVNIIFLISAQKHRLWLLVRTASARRFYRVPTIFVLRKNMKNIRIFVWKLSVFGSEIINIFEYACFRNEVNWDPVNIFKMLLHKLRGDRDKLLFFFLIGYRYWCVGKRVALLTADN